MKSFCAIIVAALCGFSLRAQTGSTGEPATNSVPRPPTTINSDSADFDMNARKAYYHGNVIVSDPQMKLTCAELVADIPESGHITHIVAETNVVIDFTDDHGQTNHVTAQKAVYDYKMQNAVTNETVTLTGNPVVQNEQGMQSGDVIIWDRVNGRFSFIHPRMTFRQSLNFMPTTNSAPPVMAMTNKPPANANRLTKPKN